VSRHAAAQEPLHVFYLGSSADLGALRRSMEAHGAVTRSRLTPGVTVVVVDSSVSANHPTVRAASSLGIPVMPPAEAIAQFAKWQISAQPPQRAPKGRRRWPWCLRRSAD
jgi:hypothetical protein